MRDPFKVVLQMANLQSGDQSQSSLGKIRERGGQHQRGGGVVRHEGLCAGSKAWWKAGRPNSRKCWELKRPKTVRVKAKVDVHAHRLETEIFKAWVNKRQRPGSTHVAEVD